MKQKYQTTDKKSLEIGIGYLSVKFREEAIMMRIGAMNRVRDVVRRKKEGISFDKPEGKKTKEEKEADRDKYKDEDLINILMELKEEGKLTDTELTRVDTILELLKDIEALEKEVTKKLIKPYAEKEEMYYAYYKHIKGVGPSLISELLNTGMKPHSVREDGTEMCPHPSSLRRYCMMDPDGAKGRKAGQTTTGNIKVKTLWWKVAKQMFMSKNPTFLRLYDTEKKRQFGLMKRGSCKNCGNTPDQHKREKGTGAVYRCKDGGIYRATIPNAPMSKIHSHLRAQRSAIQKFITWHWIIDRQLNGFPTEAGYIFNGAEKTHDLSNFIPPPYIPDILKDEKGNWDSQRPAGWIFKVGHKDWSEASDYVKKLCGKKDEEKQEKKTKGKRKK